MMVMMPYETGSPKTGMPFSTTCMPSAPMTGVEAIVAEMKPGMSERNAAVFSTPPAAVMEPTSTMMSTKNMRQPCMKSVATTER